MLRYQIHPSFYDVDWMGVVSNLSYVRWMEDMRSRLLDMSPYPLSRLMGINIAPALFSTHLDYLAPYIGTQGGLIEARIIAGDKLGRSRWALIFDFYHLESGAYLVHAEQSGCFVSLPEARPTRMPSELQTFFVDWLAPHTDFVLS